MSVRRRRVYCFEYNVVGNPATASPEDNFIEYTDSLIIYKFKQRELDVEPQAKPCFRYK